MQQPRKALVTAGLMAGLMVAALDQTVVDTAFPRMIADLGGVAIFTWVITICLLASTSVVPVVGKLADIYGRKVFYLTGMFLFVGGSMLCGLAQDMMQLILFRGLQGLGGGMLMPIAFTVVGDLYPGEQRAKMQGLFGAVWGLASIIGPKLGGWLTHYISWRWVFFINLPVGLVAALLIGLYYRESRGERRPIDYLGSVTVTAGVILLLLALVQGGEAWAWDSWQSLGLFAGAAVLLGTFLWWERRAPEPVLDLTLSRNRTFAVMSGLGFLMGAGMFGSIIFVPWFIQGVVGVNPNQAGNVLTPMMLTLVVFSALAGRLALRLAYRWQMTLGFAVVALGFWVMTHWSPATTLLQATLATMVMGAGLGLMSPVMPLAVQNAFPARRRGQVTSAITFFRQIGATVGVTLFGVVFNGQMRAHFAAEVAPRLQAAGAMLAGLGSQAGQAQAAVAALVEKPQGLVQLLLRPELQAPIPAPLREPILAAVKNMMAESLHVVFWTSLAVALIGGLVAQLLGRMTLKQQIADLGEQPSAATPPLVAD